MTAGIILYMHPANERWCCIVTSSLIAWAHTQNNPWDRSWQHWIFVKRLFWALINPCMLMLFLVNPTTYLHLLSFLNIWQRNLKSSLTEDKAHFLLHSQYHGCWWPGSWDTKKSQVLKSMLVNKDFQTWLLIGWQHSCQPIRTHVRKSLLMYIYFNMYVFLVIQAPGDARSQGISRHGIDLVFPSIFWFQHQRGQLIDGPNQRCLYWFYGMSTH